MRDCTIIQLIIAAGSRCFAFATPGGVCVSNVVALSLTWGEGWHDDLHLLVLHNEDTDTM